MDSHINPFDGLYHGPDGERHFHSSTGEGVVGGVNNYIKQKNHHKHHHAQTHDDNEEDDQPQRSPEADFNDSHVNPFDGLYHGPDGKKHFHSSTGEGVVGGVNNFKKKGSILHDVDEKLDDPLYKKYSNYNKFESPYSVSPYI